MVRRSTPQEKASHENRRRMINDGRNGLSEWLPHLESMLDDKDRQWGRSLGTREYVTINRVEVFSVLLATGLQVECESVPTEDGSWDTFRREHGEQIHNQASSLLEQIA